MIVQMVKRCLIILLSVASLCGPDQTSAHALEPGYLELQAVGELIYRVTWRKPDVNGQPMDINAILPDVCSPNQQTEVQSDGRAWVATWVAQCTETIVGQTLIIGGLDRTSTDVLFRYELHNGVSGVARLTPGETSFVVPGSPNLWFAVRDYFTLGLEHILSGFDHLLFVFALIFLIRKPRGIIGAVTSFTIAHSLTLACASFGWITLPPPPVEATIALSIVFLAAEMTRSHGKSPTLTQKNPWSVAFIFGLLHGLGFAGALREIGLPQTDISTALVSFNLGVEAGQILFIGSILLIAMAGRRLWPASPALFSASSSPGTKLVAYSIGGIASFWTLERLVAF